MPDATLGRDAVQRLCEHGWPGNIRELENVIHHARLVCRGDEIGESDLRIKAPAQKPNAVPAAHVAPPADGFELLQVALTQLLASQEPDLYARIQRTVMQRAYSICGGNQLKTAGVLGISRNVVRSLLAVSAGLIIGRVRLAAESLMPVLEVLRPIPAVAWIPVAIWLFASAEQSMVFITFIGAFFPILLSTIHGVEAIDRRLVDAALSLGAGPLDVFREVILPGALPSIVTGLSIGMGNSWFSLVTAEMISGQFGIGYYTWDPIPCRSIPTSCSA